MTDRSFIHENDTARRELSELIAGLDDRSLARPIGSGWTVSTALCHLVFWDQRALFLVREWQATGQIETPQPPHQSVESINHAVNTLGRAVPGKAAAELALSSAEAVDACVAGLSDEVVDRLISGGFDRYLKRHLHRREHLRRIRKALEQS